MLDASIWRRRISALCLGTVFILSHPFSDGKALALDWYGWVNRGGPIMEQPSCLVAWGINDIHCFARFPDNTMRVIRGTGDVWGQWKQFPGLIMDQPTCISWGVNRIDCFARSPDNTMLHNWWDGNMWQPVFLGRPGWEDLGGPIMDQPSCVAWPPRVNPPTPGRIHCFARFADNTLRHKWWDGSAWQGWENLGAPGAPGEFAAIMDQPTCISKVVNRIDCFVRNTNSDLRWKLWNGPGTLWSGWAAVGGSGGGDMEPASCLSRRAGSIDCFSRSRTSAMFYTKFDGTVWSSWEYLGGQLMARPSCVSRAENKIECLARHRDGRMWNKWQFGTTWHGWSPVPVDTGVGDIMGPPTCVTFSPTRVDCFARSSDGSMLQMTGRD